ncbi:receptor expression-enhancing protein 1 isoform X2 [Hyperolius riggenbachi]|uniref:receptor expression-enhancing protein 1 isoform X2 n=1 Tax=Hyperolius riggenbachi TaxID=752182 RepID=UPI0035A29D16
MVSWLISRLVVLIFGTLYPAYYSYKAVKSKDIKEYVKWMMYWIIFALFMTVETFTDLFLCWFPFYYELKIAFVAWLLSPYTKGSSLLYRKFVHPTLSSKEKEIDECLIQAKDRSYDALVHFGKRGLNVAATAAVTAAAKVIEHLLTLSSMDHKTGQGQGALSERLRSFSMQDLSSIRGESPSPSPVTVRATSKTTKSKLSRSSTQGSEPSVTEMDVEQTEVTYEVQEVISDEEDDDGGIVILEKPTLYKPPRRSKRPVEVLKSGVHGCHVPDFITGIDTGEAEQKVAHAPPKAATVKRMEESRTRTSLKKPQ